MAELIAIISKEVEDGFRLAGARVLAATPSDVDDSVRAACADRQAGILAIEAALYDALSDDLKARLDSSIVPVVIRVPSGLQREAELDKAEELRMLLQRTVGVRISAAPSRTGA